MRHISEVIEGIVKGIAPRVSDLTPTEVRVIRACLAEDSTMENRRFLASQFGVHVETIGKVWRGESWQGEGKMAAKPDDLKISKWESASIYEDGDVCFDRRGAGPYEDDTYVYVNARRLRAWLDDAIKWLEEGKG